MARLPYVLIGQSAQRESNPHIRHGKATGCRYIMGAFGWKLNCQRAKSTGWDSNPRRRITGAVSLPLNDQCLFVSGTGGYRTHIIRFKRPVHYPVCHTPESVGAVGVEPTTCVL